MDEKKHNVILGCGWCDKHIKENSALKKQNRILSAGNRQWFDVWDKLKEEINNPKYFSFGKNCIQVADLECIMSKLEKNSVEPERKQDACQPSTVDGDVER